MSRGKSVNETHTLSHSMGQMYVNTPFMKKQRDLEPGFPASEEDSSAPLSPPPTLDVRQKRDRSESLMLYHTNDMLTTKRRLRSRSRIGLEPEAVSSSFMSPPCSSNPQERTHSRSHFQITNESLSKCPKPIGKHPHINSHTSSVFMTPYSDERKPLQNRDLNSTNEASFQCASDLRSEQGFRCTYSDSSTDSSSDSEPTYCFEDRTKTKLTFDDESESPVAVVDVIGKRIGENKVDFIKELVNLNCEEICKKIFCYLEPRNLQRVASVSKLWRRICKKDRIASPRLDQFIHGRRQYVLQKGKENLGYNTRSDHKIPQRSPFSDLKSNTMWTPVQKKSSGGKDGLDQIKTDIMLTYERMKCPFCGSPSQRTEEKIYECEKCKGIFCSSCKHQMDEHHKTGKCGIKPNLSKKAKSKEIIGSKKSKSRLKRY